MAVANSFSGVEKRRWGSVYRSNHAGEQFDTVDHLELMAQAAINSGLMKHMPELFIGTPYPPGIWS
ncbi:hypothetical protein LQ954_06800 [Sphingomonas sp. IC-11]|uniref:hypothetical protein n=1 Tax=Sphingomonas sp. IC-11 TaxID=2898528 RepID=UPI001E62FE08|nr:hypothetical protein [Sphingomonas sp. IC-11]MCD2315854.1 hypothetical protein [Sphingomonas sp. IC-11]